MSKARTGGFMPMCIVGIARLLAADASGPTAKLGNPSVVAAGSLGRSVQTAAADAFVASLMPVVEAIRSIDQQRLRPLPKRSISAASGPHGAANGTCRPCQICWVVRRSSQQHDSFGALIDGQLSTQSSLVTRTSW